MSAGIAVYSCILEFFESNSESCETLEHSCIGRSIHDSAAGLFEFV